MEEDNKDEVTVVGNWVSLFSHRVRQALALKGIPYQYKEEDFINKSPFLKQLNPIYAKVPVLIHNGKPLPESTIILQYIDDLWEHNPRLLPQNPYQRAQARFWAKFIDEKILLPAYLIMFLEGEKKERAVKVASENLEMIEEKLKEGYDKFFGGETIGYLDLVLGFVAYILPVWEEVASVKILDASKFPGVTDWIGNFLNELAVKADCLPPTAEAVCFYEKRQKDLAPFFASPAAEKMVLQVIGV